MNTTTAIAITNQQFLNHNYFIDNLTESNIEVLNKMEFELENILLEEFKQGLPSDLNNCW